MSLLSAVFRKVYFVFGVLRERRGTDSVDMQKITVCGYMYIFYRQRIY